MSWIRDKVFNNADDFINWLDNNYGSYISKHISENHVHHTWRPDHSNNRSNSTLQLHKNMRNFHVNTNKWADIAQHITIGSDGKIVLGRNITQTPVSATGYNGGSNWHPFAYEMIGNFDIGNDVLEGKQLESAIKISRYFYDKKDKPVKFHRELLLNGKQPKTCPGTGIGKNWFMGLVKESKYDVGKVVKSDDKSTQSNQPKTGSEQITKPKTNTGGSIVDYLKANNIDSGKANRKKLAAEYGISNYTGTAAQNTQLLNKLKSGSKPADKPKSSGGDAYIRGVQQFVVDYGFSIAIDSIAGPLTKKGLIKVLQSELNKQFGAGLAVDGIPGPKTYAALVTVRKGAKGNITKVLQALLYIAGHNPGKLDGDFGGGTEKAVRSYQKAKGLTVDGVPGRATWTKLIA